MDPQLITAIIAIESGGNPAVVSKSGAVGLMQLKPSTSGRDVYRRMGWRGEPSVSELKTRNVISRWGRLSEHSGERSAGGIKDPQVMRYAVVVSYANARRAAAYLLLEPPDAIEEINDLDADEFFEHVVKTPGTAGAALYLETPESAGRHVILVWPPVVSRRPRPQKS